MNPAICLPGYDVATYFIRAEMQFRKIFQFYARCMPSRSLGSPGCKLGLRTDGATPARCWSAQADFTGQVMRGGAGMKVYPDPQMDTARMPEA
jgi:hypothetical protein